MHIGINAQLLSLTNSYRATGVSNYIYYLIRHLGAVDKQNQYSIYTGEWARDSQARARLALGDNFRLVTSNGLTRYPTMRLMWEQTFQAARAWNLDVIHGPVNVIPLLSNAQSIVTIHDLAFLLFSDKHIPAKRNYLRVMTRLSVRRAKYVIAVSEATRRTVIDHLGAAPEKVITVPEAADEEYRYMGDTAQGCAEIEAFRQKRGLPDRYFFYLGTLEPRKNIPLLLEAYSLLHREGMRKGSEAPPKLVIAGPKGWLYEEIFTKVKELCLEEFVLFPGFVPREEVTLWYNASLGFIYLSAFEGFGLPPLQAMACGVPTIVNNASSLPEVVGDAGSLVDATNSAQVAAALRDIANHPDLRVAMRQKGLERASQFSWERTAQQTLAVYEAAMRREQPIKKNADAPDY